LEGTKGVRQGCPLSGLLFVLYLDQLQTKLEEVDGGFVLKEQGETTNISIKGLFLADYIILFGESQEKLQNLVKVSEDFANEYGFQFSKEKTKTMIFQGEGMEIKMGGEVLEQVK